MNNNKEKFKIVVKTHQGLEDILAEELKNLGVESVEKLTRAVSFDGDKELLYKVNYLCRTALRVLKPVHTFTAKNEHIFYRKMKDFDWTEFIDAKGTIAVDSAVSSNYFSNSKYVFLKAKDAIVDQIRDKFGIRPSIDLDEPDIRINVRIFQDEITLSLDSSGSSLHKRGYRVNVNEAPLNEALAAGLILTSGWDRESNFIDPMCGSGTFLIEAAMYAYNIPPGSHRKKFGFQNWKDYDPVMWKNIIAKANMDMRKFNHKIIGSDISPEAVGMARSNIRLAKLDNKIELSRKAFEKQSSPGGTGVIMMNPPYGERMKPDDINALYKSMGDKLKQEYKGYEAWILSSNKEALKSLGLGTSKRLSFHAGPLELSFFNYKLYEGSLKKSKQKENLSEEEYEENNN
ncbi:MAG TPA: THUMP domain-containing protein [Ignavibacteriaceae bacterium]|nr:THUMP domain-containing protein [Ignavibacteriaceae bacterium]